MRFHPFIVRLLISSLFVLALAAMDARSRPDSAPAPLARTGVAGEQLASLDLASLHRVAQGAFILPPGAAASHASSMVVMPADSPAALTVFWFSGERESGPLVEIAASQLDRQSGKWSEPRIVLNRHDAGRQLGFGVRRLGNPVGWLDTQNRLHLFVVATGGGGWAASRILHLTQSSVSSALDGLAFAPLRVLPLSWLWNTSFLVRNAPLSLEDGGMVLPVHFELGFKIPGAVRFDEAGRMLAFARISRNNFWLQPALLPLTASHWLALMRDERHGGKIGVASTRDGGVSWSNPADLDQPNPDSSVAALALAPGKYLLAHNPVSEGRGRLDLSLSKDGVHWSVLQTLEQSGPNAEFSYPALAWVDGGLWVTYTVERERLSWQHFKPVASTGPAQSGSPGNPQ